jgi:hypothetical protein
MCVHFIHVIRYFFFWHILCLIAQADLKLSVLCLSLRSARIIGIRRHTWHLRYLMENTLPKIHLNYLNYPRDESRTHFLLYIFKDFLFIEYIVSLTVPTVGKYFIIVLYLWTDYFRTSKTYLRWSLFACCKVLINLQERQTSSLNRTSLNSQTLLAFLPRFRICNVRYQHLWIWSFPRTWNQLNRGMFPKIKNSNFL